MSEYNDRKVNMSRLITLKQSGTENSEQQMTPLMKAMKAIHSVSASGESFYLADIKKQRNSQDLLGGIAKPSMNVVTEDFTIRDIPCEWVKPEHKHNKEHVIFYCHGGGYTCGSLKYARVLASRVAEYTGMEVLSFEYRLAPENPHPAAIWNYLMQLGYGAREVILLGDSAGGNLALELALKLKSQNRLLPKGIVLMSPWTDMTMTGSSYETCKDIDPILSYGYIRTARYSYCGLNDEYNDADDEKDYTMEDEGFDFADPKFSPLFAEFDGFPPVLIQVGSNEVLKDDSVRLYEKLLKEGILVSLEEYEDAWHVFQMHPVKKSGKALEAVSKFIDGLF